MLTIEDHVVLIRLLFGSIFGFVAYLIYRFRISIFIVKTDLLIWILAAAIYVFTAYYVKKITGSTSLLYLYVRGLATFYGSWIIVFLVMYDLFH
ncbi:MAG: hypothetical protein QXT88_04165 [Desulfurococcaceae archaeon]|uniref:Uncharacterized protein n=1 Tax=Staphylothermus marinus TaxID=2280 RepID=A0A7C4JKU2_STAMA